jgi:hypothetical protein
MKTLSLILCLLLVGYGFYLAAFPMKFEGVILMAVGGFAFLIISAKTKKIAGYNPKHWMNR